MLNSFLIIIKYIWIKNCSEKYLCNQSSHNKNADDFQNPSHACATIKSTLFAVNKDEWDIKEDNGKFIKNTSYILQYAKRYLLGLKVKKLSPYPWVTLV